MCQGQGQGQGQGRDSRREESRCHLFPPFRQYNLFQNVNIIAVFTHINVYMENPRSVLCGVARKLHHVYTGLFYMNKYKNTLNPQSRTSVLSLSPLVRNPET